MLIVLLLSCDLRLASPVNTGLRGKSNEVLDFIVRQDASHHSHSCPPWTYYDEVDNSCKCYHYSDLPICEQTGETLTVLKYYCVTYNTEKQVASAGECLYHHSGIGKMYTVHIGNYTELNSAICGDFNRKGMLCSECAKGMFVPYSYHVSCIDTCVPSKVNWIKYFLITLLPTTVFYVFIIIFKINVHSSLLLGFILILQVLTSPFFAHFVEGYFRIAGHNFTYIITYIFMLLGGIWNLDFFRGIDSSICLRLSPLGQLSLEYVTVLYTLLLIAGTYILIGWHDRQVKIVVKIWKPIYKFCILFRKNWNIHSSVIDSFATFLILCNVKVLNVCIDILKPVKVYQLTQEGGYRWSVFIDPKLQYYGKHHLPYAMLAIFMFIFFVMLPIIFLLLYPTRLCQNILAKLPNRWQILLKILVDSFQGIYKDGTEPNTKDCRWFSAVPFIVRLIVLSVYIYSVDLTSSVHIGITVSLVGIITILADPCKVEVKYISTHFTVCIFITGTISMALLINNNKWIIFASFWSWNNNCHWLILDIFHTGLDQTMQEQIINLSGSWSRNEHTIVISHFYHKTDDVFHSNNIIFF